MLHNFITLVKKRDELMKKKILISSITLIIVLLSLMITVYAHHQNVNAKTLDALCSTSAPTLNPDLVLVNTDETNNQNKYQLTVKMKNTGILDWFNNEDTGEKYGLKLLDGPQALRGQIIELNNDFFIAGVHNANGEEAEFILPEQITPTTTGAIQYKWQLVKSITEEDGEVITQPFGPVCPPFIVNVVKIDAQCKNLGSAAIRVFNPDLIGITLNAQEPDHDILPNEYYVLKIKMKNLGTTTWDNNYKLEGTIGDQAVSVPITSFSQGDRLDGSNLDLTILNNNLRTVVRDQEAIFSFSVASGSRPTIPNVYPISLILTYNGKSYGETCRTNLVVVGKNEQASCEQVLLEPKDNGRRVDITLKMKNTGNTIWRRQGYPLGSNIPFLTVPTDRISMEEPIDRVAAQRYKIRPNEIATFKTSLVTSRQDLQPEFKTYDLTFRMKKDVSQVGSGQNYQEFGDTCTKQLEIKPRFAQP